MHREGRDKKQEQGVNILLLVFVQAAPKATFHEEASENFPSEKRGRDCDEPKRGATLFVVYTRLCPMYPSPLFSDPALADVACTVHFVWKTNPLHLGKINLVLPAETLPTCLAAEKAEFNLEVSGKLQELLDAWLSRNLAFTKNGKLLQLYLRSNDMFFQFYTHCFVQVLSVMSFATFCN